MGKYIDAEKLIAEIEKWSDGKLTLSLLTEIKEVITSLQQEQNIKSYCREHCQGYKDTGGKCFFEWNCPAIKQQEQQGVLSNLIDSDAFRDKLVSKVCRVFDTDPTNDNEELSFKARKED